jgi:uncharacterized protein YjbJ (UPF0337 family)
VLLRFGNDHRAMELAGKVTGNTAKELEGNIQKNAGKVRNEVGKAADEVRSQAKKNVA